MSRKSFFMNGLLAGLLLLAGPLIGQDMPDLSKPLTLEDCISYAINHNPEIRRAQLDEQNNDYVIKEVKLVGKK